MSLRATGFCLILFNAQASCAARERGKKSQELSPSVFHCQVSLWVHRHRFVPPALQPCIFLSLLCHCYCFKYICLCQVSLWILSQRFVILPHKMIILKEDIGFFFSISVWSCTPESWVRSLWSSNVTNCGRLWARNNYHHFTTFDISEAFLSPGAMLALVPLVLLALELFWPVSSR